MKQLHLASGDLVVGSSGLFAECIGGPNDGGHFYSAPDPRKKPDGWGVNESDPRFCAIMLLPRRTDVTCVVTLVRLDHRYYLHEVLDDDGFVVGHKYIHYSLCEYGVAL